MSSINCLWDYIVKSPTDITNLFPPITSVIVFLFWLLVLIIPIYFIFKSISSKKTVITISIIWFLFLGLLTFMFILIYGNPLLLPCPKLLNSENFSQYFPGMQGTSILFYPETGLETFNSDIEFTCYSSCDPLILTNKTIENRTENTVSVYATNCPKNKEKSKYLFVDTTEGIFPC